MTVRARGNPEKNKARRFHDSELGWSGGTGLTVVFMSLDSRVRGNDGACTRRNDGERVRGNDGVYAGMTVVCTEE